MTSLLGFLAVLGGLRLLELVVSARNRRLHGTRAAMPPEPLFAWMVALHSAVFVVLPLELYAFGIGFGTPPRLAAAVLVGLALILRVWTLRSIGRSWNVRVVGGPDYPIVDGGPYRFIRHPNYLVVVLELAFIPLMWGLWRAALVLTVLNALVLRVRIAHEEALLGQNPDWVARMAHKPRFLPRLIGP